MAKEKTTVTTTVTTTTTVTEREIGNPEIIAIVDRSGSMGSIKLDAQGGLNQFITEQKEIGDTKFTLVQFDDIVEFVHKQIPITEATKYTLRPRGMTALYDAIGQAINSSTAEKAIVVIVTDGMENSSNEYTADSVKTLIEAKKEAGWDFIFLAANQDAFSTGTSMGIDASRSFNFDASNSKGVHDAYAAMTTYTSAARTVGAAGALDAINQTDLANSSINSRTS